MSTFECPLQKTAREAPHQLFIEGPTPFTYREFEQYVEQIQKILNFSPGQVIAIKPLEPLFFIAVLIASMRRRLIVFPINFKLPNSEIEARLKESKAALYLDNFIPYNPNIVLQGDPVYTYHADTPITYLLTSGSSSKPKICVHSIGNHFYSALGSNTFLNYSSQDSWFLNMPLYHVSGLSLIFRTLLASASLSLSWSDNITFLSCVNTQLLRLVGTIKALPRLKTLLLGGGFPSNNLLEKAKELQLPLRQTYGLTEMSSQVATSAINSSFLSTLMHREVTLDHKHQILVRGKTLFLGYLVEQQVQRACNSQGWFETKDIGLLHNDQLQIKGREDNLFISGGENIQPEEIEYYLMQHPHVLEAIIIPKKDAEFDMRPVAFIKTTHPLHSHTIQAFLEKWLPKYKIPKEYYPLDYDSLKPSRHYLKELIDSSL